MGYFLLRGGIFVLTERNGSVLYIIFGTDSNQASPMKHFLHFLLLIAAASAATLSAASITDGVADAALLVGREYHGSDESRSRVLPKVEYQWGISLTPNLNPNLRFGTSLATTWSNADCAQEYFGASTDQSIRIGYARYAPASGVPDGDVRFGASLVYPVMPAWTVTGFITRSELVGDTQRSPVVREAGTTSVVVPLGYTALEP